MMDTGTIYPDGRLTLDGCVPMKWRALKVTSKLLIYHSPGGVWYDNGGRNYGPATIEVRELENLRRGNEPGTWRFKLKRLGISAAFHPTPAEASRQCAFDLERKGDRIAEYLKTQAEKE